MPSASVTIDPSTAAAWTANSGVPLPHEPPCRRDNGGDYSGNEHLLSCLLVLVDERFRHDLFDPIRVHVSGLHRETGTTCKDCCQKNA